MIMEVGTELVISVVSDRPGKIVSNKKNEKIKLVARNNTLVFKCAKCKKEDASKIWIFVFMKKTEIKHHFVIIVWNIIQCGEEMMLSIVNSPNLVNVDMKVENSN